MASPDHAVDVFELDATALGKAGVNAVRATFGIVGFLAFAAGIALLVWPGKTITVVAAILGVVVAFSGIARLALGIFSRGLSAAHRVLDIVLGVVVLLSGVIVLRNLAASAAALLLIAVLAIGISWIIEGVLAIVESGRGRSRAAGVTFGLLSILAGIFVLVWPGLSILAFATLAAVSLIILGISGLMRAAAFGKTEAAAPKPA